MRVAIVGFYHETNTFAPEPNRGMDAHLLTGENLLSEAHPKSYIGGFVEGSRRADVELVPLVDIRFVHGGIIHRSVFEAYRDRIVQALAGARPLDGVYFAFHGALTAEPPYTDGEASILRAARDCLGADIPFVATYDFHGIYTDWEITAAVPFPLNTNPHIDGFERGIEAGQCLLQMLDGRVHPVTHIVRVPIIGPNIGQSTWALDASEEQRLPLYQLNCLREDLERTERVLNLTIQGGYGYADTPYAGMSIIATTDGDLELAERLANRLATELWARREDIRTVRPITPLDEGVKLAIHGAKEQRPVCLVDLGDDPGSAAPADSPVVLESLLRHGAQDCVLTIRDPEVVQAGIEAGVGATLDVMVGAKIDRRFYRSIPVTGHVKLIDDGEYNVTGPTHGGWGREVTKEAFRQEHVGPRVVLRIADRTDVIFSSETTGKDRDFFRSAGIVFEEKQIVVVKSNQAHRASFDPIVAATINLDTPGVSTVHYDDLPFRMLPRPMFPLDLDMDWRV